MDNRETILACALRLFAAQGYDAVGVQEVAEAAGITKPTLYHYFGSKAGLLAALLEESFQTLNEAIRQAAEYHGDLPRTLRQITRVYFHEALQRPTQTRLQLALWFAPLESEGHLMSAQWLETQHQILEDLFTQATRDHGNMRGRQRVYAASFTGMLNTCLGLALNGYGVLDETRLEQAVHQFEHGIYS